MALKASAMFAVDKTGEIIDMSVRNKEKAAHAHFFIYMTTKTRANRTHCGEFKDNDNSPH